MVQSGAGRRLCWRKSDAGCWRPRSSSSSSQSVRDWSLFPSDLLVSVAELLGIAEIARLRAVCRRWAWALGWPIRGWPSPSRYQLRFVPIEESSVPWILLPNDDGEKADYCMFLRLTDHAVHKIPSLPEMVGRRCFGGSPDGWMVTLDLALNPRIFNPLTKEEFPLPSLISLFKDEMQIGVTRSHVDGSITRFVPIDPERRDFSLEEFRDYGVRRIILSSAPPLGIAAVIYGIESIVSHVAFARTGDVAWCPISETTYAGIKNAMYSEVIDVIYREEDRMFYASTDSGGVIVFDLNDYEHPTCWCLPSKIELPYNFFGLIHIGFSSNGELLLISRYVKRFGTNKAIDLYAQGEPLIMSDDDENDDLNMHTIDVKEETVFIKIHKLDPAASSGQWIRVRDLGDDAIFVGCNHSRCISTVNKPWLKRNCIYFIEDTNVLDLPYCYNYSRDGGIYDLKSGTFDRFFPSDCKVNWPPPVWFTPARLQLRIEP